MAFYRLEEKQNSASREKNDHKSHKTSQNISVNISCTQQFCFDPQPNIRLSWLANRGRYSAEILPHFQVTELDSVGFQLPTGFLPPTLTYMQLLSLIKWFLKDARVCLPLERQPEMRHAKKESAATEGEDAVRV